MKLWKRIRYLLNREAHDQDLKEEMRIHREMAEEKLSQLGKSKDKAHYEAMRAFGNATFAQEVSRAEWTLFFETFAQDLRFGARTLRKSPGFTGVVILTLALGIGVNTAVFGFADALLFRPLPVRDAGELMSLFHTTKEGGISSFSFPDYIEFRDRDDAFSGVAAYSDIEVELGEGEQSERLSAAIVSGNYFSVLGVKPELGRTFLPEEDRTPGTHLVAIISDSLWKTRFGADPNISDKQVMLNGHRFTVIGVAPPSFRSLEIYSVPQVWVPLMTFGETMPSFKAFGTVLFGNRGTHWLNLVGRVRTGGGCQQTQSATEAIANWQAKSYPQTNQQWSVLVVPVNDARLGSPVRGTAIILTQLLLALAGLVLLIACANVANLLLSRSVSRRREMGMRLALGASRSRLIRQLTTESLLLSLLGGALGLFLAGWSSSLISALQLTTLFPGLAVQIDSRVLGFALILSILTAVLFGAAPAYQTSAVTVAQVIKEGDQTKLRGRRFHFRHALITLQVTLSLILLIAAGLTMKTLLNLQRVDLGFNAERLVLAAVDIGSQDYTDAAGTAFYQELLGRIRALPGVESASLAFSIPFGGSNMADDVFLADGKRFNVRMNDIGLDYFRSMSIPLLRGRDFSERDHAGSPRVAIMNEALAERFWPGEDPLGKRVRIYDPRSPGPMIEVIGVVKNGRYYRAWHDPEQPFMFLPFTQQYLPNMTLHIHCQGAVGPVITGLRRELQRLNNKLAVQDVRTMPEAMARAVILERTGAGLISLFGFLALAIAAFGIFGVVSFTVSQRTHEIGIRIALGARKQDILRLIGRQCVTPIFLGIIFGGLAAIMVSRFMSKLLYGVDPIDLTTYLLATTVLIGVGLLACFLPARRAAHVDPLVALRNE